MWNILYVSICDSSSLENISNILNKQNIAPVKYYTLPIFYY